MEFLLTGATFKAARLPSETLLEYFSPGRFQKNPTLNDFSESGRVLVFIQLFSQPTLRILSLVSVSVCLCLFEMKL